MTFRPFPILPTLLAQVILLLILPLSGAENLADTLDRTKGGLVISIGATDGRFEAAAAGNGRFLVHCLTLDDIKRDAARAAILSAARYGLASVATWQDRSRLPYASNLANVLVANLDELAAAAPTREEMERVLAPGGSLFLLKNGKRTEFVKPRPDGMDDWGHFDHDASGLGSSSDVFVEPVRQQQWLTSLMPIPVEGNPAGYDPGAGVRISGRFCLMDVSDSREAPEKASKKDFWELHCRDAFNGTPLWSLPREFEASRSRWSLAASDGVAYTWLKKEGELTALDLATGKTLRTFPGTAAPEAMTSGEALFVRVEKNVLLVGLRDKLLCFELKSGELAWEYTREGLYLLGPILDVEKQRVFAILSGPESRFSFRGRWPAAQSVQGILALDLKTGKPVWECDEVQSEKLANGEKKGDRIRGVGQLILTEKHLVVFGSKAISGGKSPYLASLDLETGKLLHADDVPFVSNYNAASYNALLRNGEIYFAGAFTRVWKYDPASGKTEPVVTDSWNQRCTRFAATPRFLMFGQAAYYGEDYAGIQVSVGRSGCALPNTPANGMTYFTPTMCGCTTLVRGFQAMTGDPFVKPTADILRLVTGGKTFSATASSDLPAGPVAQDWLKQEKAGQIELPPVIAGELEITVFPQQHRLEARRGGKAIWSFLANARISSPPVLANGALIFGSHDGWVYAVNPDGALRWKYLLAPAERLVGINGQLENTWPVYGVTLMDGKIIASAGTHVELDGGVTVAALDPSTGKPTWIKHLKKSPSLVPPGKKNANIVSHSFINSVPKIAGKMIELGEGGRKGGRFSLSPEEDEALLNKRLNNPEKKKK